MFSASMQCIGISIAKWKFKSFGKRPQMERRSNAVMMLSFTEIQADKLDIRELRKINKTCFWRGNFLFHLSRDCTNPEGPQIGGLGFYMSA